MISLEQIPIYHPFFKSITSLGFYLPGRIKIPLDVIIFILVFIIGLYIAHFTRFGRNVYAIGGNPQSALLMGLPIGRTKILIYTMSGLLSALAGIVYTLNTPAGNGLSGRGVELDAIACVVIGGTLLSGGVGYVAGTFIGVLIQAIIKTYLSFSSLSSWYTKIAIGLLILIFILLQGFLSKTSKFSKSAQVTFTKVKDENTVDGVDMS
jgi:ribose/xylose/arabinose/galactoside ABC-type transport system permease subunit